LLKHFHKFLETLAALLSATTISELQTALALLEHVLENPFLFQQLLLFAQLQLRHFISSISSINASAHLVALQMILNQFMTAMIYNFSLSTV
jgi:hypothetical protein